MVNKRKKEKDIIFLTKQTFSFFHFSSLNIQTKAKPIIIRSLFWIIFILMSTLSLSAQIRLEGRVTSPEGTPIAGALVAAVPEGSNPPLTKIPVDRSDPAGRFALLSGPGRVGFTVTASGYKPFFQSLDLKDDEAILQLEIQLERGGCHVRGTISDIQGRIPSDVNVAFSMNYEGDFFFADVKNGIFDVFLTEGPYYVMAEAEGLSPITEAVEIKSPVEMIHLTLPPEATPAPPSVRRWIRSHAIPFRTVEVGHGYQDLMPLKDLIGDATVVAIGEATHGTREFSQIKHRLLEFLVAEMGFSVFCIEASFPDAYAVNDYILTGKGDPSVALAGLRYWTCNTQEVLDMIRWMRRYNKSPLHRRKIKFYGFDINSPSSAYAQVKSWLDRVDPDGAELFKINKDILTSPTKAQNLKEAIARHIIRLDSKKSELIRSKDTITFERQRQNLRVLAQWAEKQNDPFGGVKVRDEAMAANLLWIQAQEPGSKLLLWAHNSHVSFREGSMLSANPMGWHLRRALGKDYLACGLVFREGQFLAMDIGPENKGIIPFTVEPNPSATLDAALAAAELPVLALDLRRLPGKGPERPWFDNPQGTWQIGSGFSIEDQDRFVVSSPVTDDYDMIVFLARTSAARPNASLARGERSGTLPPGFPASAPKNLGFEEGPDEEPPLDWLILMAKSYDIKCVTDNPTEGRLCLRVKFKGKPTGNDGMNLMQGIEAEPYLGKKIRLTGWIRTDGRPGNRGALFVRADTDLQTQKYGFFDNMSDRPVTVTTWTKAVIEGVVDPDAKILNFGCYVRGTGTFWFDGITLEIIE